MRQTYYFLSFVLLLFVFISCSNDVVGKGTDTIGLETKEVFFKSSKDSIELRTRKGDDWWLTEISTKDTIYRTHSLNVQVIEGGGLYVEKTGRKSIFIRIDSNLTLNPQLHSRSATYIKRNGLLIRKITIKSSRPFQCAYHPLTP